MIRAQYVEALAIWRPLGRRGRCDGPVPDRDDLRARRGRAPASRRWPVEWYERAARAGHPPSQYQLGRLYRDGVGVKRNAAEAFAWFSLAAESIPKDAAGSQQRIPRPKKISRAISSADALNAARKRLDRHPFGNRPSTDKLSTAIAERPPYRRRITIRNTDLNDP